MKVSRRRFLESGAFLSSLLFPVSGKALQAGEPSRTARGAALQRAAHQLLESPAVLEDPLALRIFGAQAVAWLGQNLDYYRTPSSRGMRAFLVMRSRYAEDELAHAYESGTRQYVVLGAGLDTFAYRNPHRGLRVFEVDHPDTQAWKRRRLAAQAIDAPSSLRFVSVDFEKQRLADRLQASGFRADRPAFFSWLGVTIYLTPEAVAGTLSTIARCAAGSQVVFDFAPPPAELNAAERRRFERSARGVARSGEPWINFYSPDQFAGQLRASGYSVAQVSGSDEMNRRYFGARTDGFRLYGSGRMMSAQV
jgi:methyltransferase (TIGR00027 family)